MSTATAVQIVARPLLTAEDHARHADIVQKVATRELRARAAGRTFEADECAGYLLEIERGYQLKVTAWILPNGSVEYRS